MIKFENDIFYLSAGETCYIFRLTDGVPRHVYFGKRVEPEDELGALGYGDGTPELIAEAVIEGKRVNIDFVFDCAAVTDDDNGKTLVVELTDKKAKLKALMYYTPHPRGGIFRRVEIENAGSVKAKLTLVRQAVGCGGFANNVKTNQGNGFSAVCGGEYSGDAYGFLCADADGNVELKQMGDGVAAVCETAGEIATDDLGKTACPELLCVYSDVGKGGVSRIFHDILRETPNSLFERAAVLFLPKTAHADIAQAVKAAVELGFGIVAIDCAEYGIQAVQEFAAVCRELGISSGLRVNRDKVGDGTTELYNLLHAAVAQNGIRYVMIDAPADVNDGNAVRGMFAIKNMLKKEFDGLRVDLGMPSYETSKAFTEFYPLEYVRNIVSPQPTEDFKARFDCATLGTLGYELDPLKLSDGIKRAVRAQILSYQDDALTVMHGDIYTQPFCRMAVSKDKSRAYAVCDGKKANGGRIRLFGLDEHNLYHVHEKNKTFSGAALVHCGITIGAEGIYVFHIRQVADY